MCGRPERCCPPFSDAKQLFPAKSAKVGLNAGLNVLEFKVVNEAQGWQGSVRFSDAAGRPVKGLRVTLDPSGDRH
jgi:hypothetical protein